MAETSRLESWFGRLGSVLTAWPRLIMAAAVAAAVLIVTLFRGNTPTTSLLIAWDCGVAFYLAVLAPLIAGAMSDEIRRRAARQDFGQFIVLALTAVAALASVAAIYAELGTGGAANAGWKLVLALLTIVLSWLFIHIIFAVHYAHQYFGPDSGKLKGLSFPGEDNPDYWDFIYFAMVIGMTSQVSDVAVTDRRIRRTVAAHGVVAFFFNVALLALVVNIAADVVRHQ